MTVQTYRVLQLNCVGKTSCLCQSPAHAAHELMRLDNEVEVFGATQLRRSSSWGNWWVRWWRSRGSGPPWCLWARARSSSPVVCPVRLWCCREEGEESNNHIKPETKYVVCFLDRRLPSWGGGLYRNWLKLSELLRSGALCFYGCTSM